MAVLTSIECIAACMFLKSSVSNDPPGVACCVSLHPYTLSWLLLAGNSRKIPARVFRFVLLLWFRSFLAGIAEDEGKEFFESVEVKTVDGSGHWIAEENPEGFVQAVVEWVEKQR